MTRKQISAAVVTLVLAVAAPLLILALLHSHGGDTQAAPVSACTAPDNGTGTITLPPLNCEYVAPDEPMMIIDGLPPGTTIELDPILDWFLCTNPAICSMPLLPGECEMLGGSLGGHGCCADATLDLTVAGTGSLAGFNRHLAVPVALEAHSGPRNPGDPVQTFPRDMYRLQGELFGDPDFCTLRITAGTDFGLPSPGQTTLSQLPSGDYDVDSFFDITYQIEFEGCPASPIQDYAGTTTATVRLQMGVGSPPGVLKWEQAPDLAPTGLDVMAQIPWVNITLADDFQCTETGYITQIDFWGSWYHDILPADDPEAVSFTLSMHSDVPAGVDGPYSHPGELLWLHTFLPGECQAVLYADELTEGWFYPSEDYYEAFADTMVWLYRCPIPEEYWFYQEDGTIYWLDVTAYPEVESYFGWKTSLDHWNDDGGYASGEEPIDPSAWAELRYPLTHPLEGESIDLAFQLWGIPEPVVQTSKWQQTPDLAPTGMDVSAYAPDFILADDFQCTTPGPITEIDVWGSWFNDILPSGGADDVSFTLSIHEDIPAGGGEPSQPGALLWSWDSPEFTVRPYQVGIEEGWLEPPADYTPPPADTIAWEYTFDLDPAQYCTALDNGSGTIDLPAANCDYVSPGGPMEIIQGLPPGTTIELNPTFDDYVCNVARPWCTIALASGVCEGAGGALGGTASCAEATLELDVTGTGSLAGFNRTLWVPMNAEFHWAARTPGDPVQTFDADMYRLEGELFGDPDFCTLRVKAGRVNGLPGPGQTTLTEKASGNFDVDSFFDITYQIEFEGCPASPIEDYMGTTAGMATIRYGPPTFIQEGTSDDPIIYWLDVQADTGGEEAYFGWKTSLDHWTDDGAWATEPVSPFCAAPDDGSGTAKLPATAQDCEYIAAPGEVMEIIDGLPPGTTIELDPIFDWFICTSPPCETPGGTLGGTVSDIDEATLDLTVSGTGDLAGFNRHLAVPISPAEFHWASRTPGDPVQTFAGDMYRLEGELFGDPDFCTLIITAGTANGLPSPGQATLGQLPSGDFAVDSFFDITYQITFEGCPGSVLEDYSGTTTATVRLLIVESGWTGWSELVYPAGHPMVGASIDLAFEIWGREVPVEEEETYKWLQTPDVNTTGMDVRANYPDFVLADDLQCAAPGPITEIVIWGSWLDDVLPAGGADDVSFTLSIHEDVPAAGEEPSHPGDLLWLWESPEFTVDLYQGGLQEGWLAPPDNYTPSGDTIAWEYTFNVDPNQYCTAPENGTGTIDLPPLDCDYVAPDEPLKIINGLPPGTTIELDPILMDFLCTNPGICSLPLPPSECEMLGGSLGGHGCCAEATLDLTVTGTGSLAGFNRHLAVPVELEAHSASRNPGDPVQTFARDMYRLQGELFGDPDFCTLRVTAGTDYGLPSPGWTTLTQLPSGDYAVDSFFDITYQIEFEGCPASVLEDYMGTTTETTTLRYGPATFVQQGTDGDPIIYWLDVQANSDEGLFGWKTSLDQWNDDGAWVEGTEPVVLGPLCRPPDNGTGTIELPARDEDYCDYISLYETMMIIDGLPPGTTIELDPILMDFLCTNPGICSLSPPAGKCETAGGSLGGDGSCAEATLDLDVTGTGSLAGFNRHLAVPVELEAHSASRNPGDPVQTFARAMYRFQGELFGDPDFCTFRVTAGTDNGLPGPGQTTLTELPSGEYGVDSFFDITYQIEFEGCPASQLEDYMGTTTATIRLEVPEDAIEWSELLYPAGHPMEGQSVDLAFAVQSEERCSAGVDTDGDTFNDEIEWYLPADCMDDCTNNIGVHDAWPLDINKDKFVTVVGDVLAYSGRIGAWGGPPADPNWMRRADLNMDNFITVVGDVLAFSGKVGETCT
jgi:hypothetical protein